VGKLKINVVPNPSCDLKRIVPPKLSVIFFTMANPNPVPADFVVKNGVNILDCKSVFIPDPLSENSRIVNLLSS